MSSTFLVCDHEAIGERVRQALRRGKVDCPPTNLVTLDRAASRLSQEKAALVVLCLSPDPEQAITALKAFRALVPGRVLAVGPAAESRLILRVLRGGADDYADESDLDGDFAKALSRMASGQSTVVEPGRIVAVLGAAGGSGSSTVAANLGVLFAREHKKALLIDLRLATGDLASLLDLKPSYSLIDSCQNVDRMDQVMFERTLAAHESGLSLLASPRRYEGLDFISHERIREVLTFAASAFPHVVVDVDPNLRDEQLQAVRQAEVTVLVLPLEFNALRNARQIIEYFERKGIERDRVRLVVNRQGRAREVPIAKVEEALQLKAVQVIPDEPKVVNRANNNGVPVVVEAPSSKVAKSLVKLVASLAAKPKGP